MRKIKNVEDALALFELCTIIHDECNKSGDYRKSNKALDDKRKVIKYLLENDSIQNLEVFYKSSNLFARLSAATYFAPIDNENCYRIVKEIMDMNEGWASFEAKYTLKEWTKVSSLEVYDKILSE